MMSRDPNAIPAEIVSEQLYKGMRRKLGEDEITGRDSDQWLWDLMEIEDQGQIETSMLNALAESIGELIDRRKRRMETEDEYSALMEEVDAIIAKRIAPVPWPPTFEDDEFPDEATEAVSKPNEEAENAVDVQEAE